MRTAGSSLALVLCWMVCSITLAQGADQAQLFSRQVICLDGDWLLATDPSNQGVAQKWFEHPVAQAKRTRVPWIIQDAFPAYHGVAWYWRRV